MRLTIRPEQKLVIETIAQESFVRRLAAHLRQEYSTAAVTLPGEEKSTVDELSEETLHDLVRVAIARARGYELKQESSIAAFAAVMFEVSPNFDKHRLCQVLLSDEEVEPDARIGEMLDVLTEKNWDSIREDYDPEAWKPEQKSVDENEKQEKEKSPSAKPDNVDLQETVKI